MNLVEVRLRLRASLAEAVEFDGDVAVFLGVGLAHGSHHRELLLGGRGGLLGVVELLSEGVELLDGRGRGRRGIASRPRGVTGHGPRGRLLQTSAQLVSLSLDRLALLDGRVELGPERFALVDRLLQLRLEPLDVLVPLLEQFCG